MKPRTYLIIAGIAILAIWLLKDAVCTPSTAPVNIDSIHYSYQHRIDSINGILTSTTGQLLDLHFQRRQDSSAIARAIAVGKVSNTRLSQAIEANKRLAAANDTLARLANCDTMAAYASGLQVGFDSLTKLLPAYQQTIDEMVGMYDDAMSAANAKAIALTQERDAIRAVVREQLATTVPVSPITFGLHAGYGISSGGLSPVISVGINYQLNFRKLFKRKP